MWIVGVFPNRERNERSVNSVHGDNIDTSKCGMMAQEDATIGVPMEHWICLEIKIDPVRLLVVEK